MTHLPGRRTTETLENSFVPIDSSLKTVDWTFGHYGYVDSNALMYINGFDTWLNNLNRELLNNRNHVDSEYLFLWIIKNIVEKQGNVLAGLNQALFLIQSKRISGRLNILFSDNSGVYSYINSYEIPTITSYSHYIIAYHITGSLYNLHNYSICRWAKTPNNWDNIEKHNLYHHQLNGEVKIYNQFDKAIWGKFNTCVT